MIFNIKEKSSLQLRFFLSEPLLDFVDHEQGNTRVTGYQLEFMLYKTDKGGKMSLKGTEKIGYTARNFYICARPVQVALAFNGG